MPTARFGVFDDARRAPARSSATLPGPFVVKTDGLAAGKGVLVDRRPRRGRGRRRRQAVGPGLRRRRAAGRDRRGARSASECSLSGARATGSRAVPLARRPGLQAGPRRGRAGRTPAAWALLAGARGRRRAGRPGHGRGRRADVADAARGGASTTAACSTPGSCSPPTGRGARVQRPLRRPRGPGRPASAGRRPGRRSCWRWPTGRLREPPRVRRRRGGLRRAGRGRATPSAPVDGRRDRRASAPTASSPTGRRA